MTKAAVLAQMGNTNQTFRNRIINGAMAIDQRNAGASVSTSSTGVYTVDRWATVAGGTATTWQRVSGSSSGFQYAMQITGAASNSQVGIYQRIEAANIWDLAGQTAVLSFTVSSSTLTSLGVQFGYPSASDNWASATTFGYTGLTISSTPTRVSVLVSVPSGATNGLSVQIGTGALTSGTLTITGVQLEAGTTATPFEQRLYGTELQLCQRYYWKNEPTGAYFAYASGFSNTSTQAECYMKFPVRMRAAPTAAYSGLRIRVTGASPAVTSLASNYTSTDSTDIAFNVASGLSAGYGCIVQNNGSTSDYISFDSEL